MTKTIEIELTIKPEDVAVKASRLLADASGLSQAKIKDAMQKGAVWLQRGQSQKRLRRASKTLKAGDVLQLNYHPQILSQTVPKPTLIHDSSDYSVWFKPCGMACQGSRWGDFASIDRWVALNGFEDKQRPVHLVHRLDRATTGLILLAHNKKAARLFSEMFASGQIDKRYQAIVKGDFSKCANPLRVDEPIDGKSSSTEFSLVEFKNGKSLLDVKLMTGRKHQIRRHLSGIGFPIVGDRLYGHGADDGTDLQLQSVRLAFDCPFKGEKQVFQLDQKFQLKWHASNI